MVKSQAEITFADANYSDVSKFLEGAGASLRTFRYFETRNIDTIKNHEYTCVVLKREFIIGYGHLEKEAGKNWLGMALTPTYRGKGIGKKLLHHLLEKASILELDPIYLTVDKSNERALKMYLNFGFILETELSLKVLLLKKVGTIEI